MMIPSLAALEPLHDHETTSDSIQSISGAGFSAPERDGWSDRKVIDWNKYPSILKHEIKKYEDDPSKASISLKNSIGDIIADCLSDDLLDDTPGLKQCVNVQPAIYQDLMGMRLMPDIKHEFITYTAAFAEFYKNQLYDRIIVNLWWQAVAPYNMDRDKLTQTPYHWFDEKKKIGPQFAYIAMVVIGMIKIYIPSRYLHEATIV